jgi:hypothetical protein
MYNKYIIPPYQSGGLILPQYSGAQQSYALPGSGMQTLNTFMQIDQQSQQRYMQQQQLNMQRSQQTQNMINGTIDMQLRRSQQERVNKQIDLQNKKFEYEQLQNGIKMQQEALAWGKDEFLPGDQTKLDELLKPLNDKIANTDTNDIMQIAKYDREKRMIAMQYKNGYKNKQEFERFASALKDNPNDELIKQAIDGGYGDYDAINKYTEVSKDYYKNLDMFRKTGDRTYLDAADKLSPQISILGDFINEDLRTEATNAKIAEQKTNSALRLANAKKAQVAAQIAEEQAPFELSKLRFEQEQEKRKNADFDKWEKDNPNATWEERDVVRDRIFGNKALQQDTRSLEERHADALLKGNYEEAAAIEQSIKDITNAKDKTTTVNYTTDRKGIVDKDGSINYGGYGTDKDNVWAWGIYGNNQIERKQIKDEIDAKTVIPQSDGSLKIIDDATVMKIFGIEETSNFGFGNTDAQDIKAAIPGAKKVGGSWIIPKDNVALPQQTNTSGGGSNINSAFRNNPGTSTNITNRSSAL